MTMAAEHFCDGLESQPRPYIGTVLVTGATGYVGGRLAPDLLGAGVSRAGTCPRGRDGGSGTPAGRGSRRGGGLGPGRFEERPARRSYGLLPHSFPPERPQKLQGMDAVNARNFRQVAEDNGVRRFIYRGGRGDVRTVLSPHLRSRMRVAEELQSSSQVKTTVLRAAIIIGSGSASYEIIHHLVMGQ